MDPEIEKTKEGLIYDDINNLLKHCQWHVKYILCIHNVNATFLTIDESCY